MHHIYIHKTRVCIYIFKNIVINITQYFFTIEMKKVDFFVFTDTET